MKVKMKIKDLLDSPEKWTKRAFARDKTGGVVSEFSDDAVCWCLLGAAVKCHNYNDEFAHACEKLEQAVDTLFSHFGQASVFNDAADTTFADVRKVLELADV